MRAGEKCGIFLRLLNRFLHRFYLLDFEYKIFKHRPEEMKHSYLIKGKEVALKN